MKVLSLCDGYSSGRLALDILDKKVERYVAYEIDPNALAVSQDNWTDIEYKGDILKFDLEEDYFDLVLSGTPCTSVSLANKGGGNITEGESALFFKFYEILQQVKLINPNVKFLFENVPMNKFSKDTITDLLKVEPLIINSNLVSFQNRKRLYWTNIKVDDNIEDKEIYLKDNYSKTYDDKLVLKGKGLNKLSRDRCRVTDVKSLKCPTIMKSQEKLPTDAIVFKDNDVYRYPTREECEMMQNLPSNYTKSVNYRIATGLIGNAWTINIITHLLKNL